MEEFFTELCIRLNDEKTVKWMDVVNETVLRNGEWFKENRVIQLGKIHGLKLV